MNLFKTRNISTDIKNKLMVTKREQRGHLGRHLHEVRVLWIPKGGDFQVEFWTGINLAMASSLECLRDRKLANMTGAGESDGRVAGNESGGNMQWGFRPSVFDRPLLQGSEQVTDMKCSVLNVPLWLLQRALTLAARVDGDVKWGDGGEFDHGGVIEGGWIG